MIKPAIIAFLVGHCVFQSPSVYSQEERRGTEVREIDALRQTFERIVQERELLTAQLEAVVLDDSRSPDERANAAMLLGQLGFKRSLRFLVDHIDLKVTKKVLTSDWDRMQQMPCVYGLRLSSWNAVPLILDYLEEEPNARDQTLDLYSILARFPGRQAAVSLLRDRLRTRNVSDAARENITRLIELLEE